ncbi:hypothetical protein DMH27_17610 [Raoultella planticola]|nr:hypothetical protein [Raoultella planticola]
MLESQKQGVMDEHMRKGLLGELLFLENIWIVVPLFYMQLMGGQAQKVQIKISCILKDGTKLRALVFHHQMSPFHHLNN